MSLDNMVIFNGFTGAIARIDKGNEDIIENLFKNNGISFASIVESIPDSLIQDLYKSGYLIDQDFDEIQYLRIVSNKIRYGGLSRGLGVSITSSCNFACTYCYQKGKTEIKNVITRDVIDRIAHLISIDKKRLHVLQLFGGEPLLYVDKCCELISKCRSSSQKSNGNLLTSITTNGYYLSKDVALELKDNDVGLVQVTIDGTKEIHDSRRVLKSGRGTYDKILENIHEASKHLKIHVRVNTETGINCNLEALKSELNNDNISISVKPTDYSHCGDINAIRENRENINLLMPLESSEKSFLFASVPSCITARYDSIIVSPDGNILKCFSETGEDDTAEYGNILTQTNADLRSLVNWMSWDPYSPESLCYSCKILPTCAGGCPYQYVKYGQPGCLYTTQEYERFILANYLRRTQESTTQP